MLENKLSGSPAELYRPVDYLLSLGGKRLRPAALLMGHFLFADDVEKSMPAAYAIEVFHNFTLMHDDIMDAAPLRRGKPTVHEKYGLNAGILSGDVMLVYAYDYLLRLELQRLPAVLKVFNQTAIEVCEGQQMDMNFETRNDVTIGEYIRMIELKTSVLLAAALQIGALLGNADEADAKALYEFGRNLGIAFQLQDDVLDTYGDPVKFGKKTGGDIAQNKRTFLYLKALELASDTDRKALLNHYSNAAKDNEKKIREVIGIFNKLDIKVLAENEKLRFQDAALGYLSSVNAPPKRKKILGDFAHSLLQREL